MEQVAQSSERVGRGTAVVWTIGVALSLASSLVLMVQVLRVRALLIDNESLWLPSLGVVGAGLVAVVLAGAGISLRPQVPRPKNGSRAAGVAAVTGLLMVSSLVSAGWVSWHPLPQQRQVPVPADTASPQDVVRALIAAYDAHDVATVRALYDPRARPGSEAEADVFVHVRLVSIGQPIAITEAQDWRSSSVIGGVEVPVELELYTRTVSGWTNGPNSWGYTLVRTGPQGAWRVIDQGVG